MDLSSPKIEISNQLRARCCRRVAQFELRIASEKEYYIYTSIYIYYHCILTNPINVVLTCIHLHICICMHVRMYVSMYVCIVYIYIYIHK